MLKIVLPLVLALGGLGAGLGAGLVLRPEALAAADACVAGAEAHGAEPARGAVPGQGPEVGEAAPAPCAQASAPAAVLETVSLDKPFVVPLFEDRKVAGMVVMSVSLELAQGRGGDVAALQPRLRDGFLAAMFRHANSGGFDGAFTEGQKMADLKAALLAAARAVMPAAGIGEVLVTEIVRQDV